MNSRVVLCVIVAVGLVAGCATTSSIGPSTPPATTMQPTAHPGALTEAASNTAIEPTGTSAASELPGSESVAAATVVAAIPLAGFPGGPSAGSHALWSWDEATGKVIRIDTTTNKVVATISLGDPSVTPYGSPKAIAVDGPVVWVTDVLRHAVARIDPATNTIAERILLDKVGSPAVSGPIEPFGLALDGAVLWVSDFDQGVVLRVDTTTKTVTKVIADIDHPEGLAIGFGSLWVVEHRKGAVTRISLRDGSVGPPIALPGTGPDGVCGMCVDSIAASSTGVWVPLDLGKAVARIDPATNAVATQVPFDRVVDSLAVGDGAVWVAAWDGSIPCTDTGAYIARIDGISDTVTGTTMIPCAVGVAVDDGAVWAATADAPNGVTRLDPAL